MTESPPSRRSAAQPHNALARAPVPPLPPEVTEHPAWRMIWRKLLAPLPAEAHAATRERDTTNRDAA